MPGQEHARHLVCLQDVSVTRSGRSLLHRVTYCLEPGISVIVLGANGSGKTTLLKLLRGDIWPDQDGVGIRRYLASGTAGPIGFRETTAMVSPHMQDAFTRHELSLPVSHIVAAGVTEALRPVLRLDQPLRALAEAALIRLDISHLADRGYLSLSRGEARMVLLARALVRNPRFLFLDEPLSGLDRAARDRWLYTLSRLKSQGISFCLTGHRASELPADGVRVVHLDQGRITSSAVKPLNQTPRKAVSAIPDFSLSDGASLIEFCNAEVRVRGGTLLHLDRWTIRRGENWAVTGNNGSGKTTLLDLICGRLSPYTGGSVRRCLPSSDVSLAGIRRCVGYVSPRLQAELPGTLTVREAVLAAICGGDRAAALATRDQRREADRILAGHGLSGISGIRLNALSYGQVRRVLLAAELGRGPALLLLDEPMNGLDSGVRAFLREQLDLLSGKTTIVMATHHLEDLPSCITFRLHLEAGKVRSEGPYSPPSP